MNQRFLMQYFLTLVFIFLIFGKINAASAFNGMISHAYQVGSETLDVIDINVGLIIFPPLTAQDKNHEYGGEVLGKLNPIFMAPEFKLHVICASPSRIYREFAANNIDLTVSVKSNSNLPNNVSISALPFAHLKVML